MLTTSAEYKAAITATTRSMLVRANISGVDVDPRYITRVQITEDMTRDDQLGIGAAPAAVLELEMRMPSPAVALAAAEIKIYYDLKTVAGTETIPLGVYIAAEVSSSTGYQTINIKAYDRMAALGAEPYSTTVTTWPASAEDIAADICAQNGLDIADGTAWPAQEVPQSISEAGYTAREVIGFIAGMAGKNAHIDRAGALTLKGFRPAGGGETREATRALQHIDGFKRRTADDLVISSITTGTAEAPIIAGSGRGLTFRNPYITQDSADAIQADMYGLTYAPADLRWRGDPAVEIGDTIQAETRSGDTVNIPVARRTLTIGGGLKSEIEAPGAEDGFIAMGAAPTDKKISRMYAGLTEALQAATEKISGAAGGYFRIETDALGFPSGWIISDTPVITPYTKLWRFNAAGLAWSDNGGAAYSNIAITMDGQISANAITTGTLAAERIAVEQYGGAGETTLEQYIRFEAGRISLGKADNELELRIDNDKISFISGAGTEGERTVAYFSNNSLEIVDVTRVRFGPFGYLPRASGNLTFTKVVD